jgi:hypothetical protein
MRRSICQVFAMSRCERFDREITSNVSSGSFQDVWPMGSFYLPPVCVEENSDQKGVWRARERRQMPDNG